MTSTMKGNTAVVIGGNVQINLHQTIDFKIPTDNKITVGVVRQFKPAPESTGSIWMEVAEVENQDKHWISCNGWHEQYSAGMFKPITQETKTEDNGNTTDENPDDLPF